MEGLRAVAVLLVVLFHAGIPHLTGGYVGVDVFFVISGFVITGVLLREREASGGTSFFDFYARRVRRILPAATLVILVTVVATYLSLGVVSGINVADDGRWAAVFLANVHFAAVGTNYLAGFRPPSPLQNFWTLSVEEQFYLVYPTVFLVLVRWGRSRARGGPDRARLAGGLVVIMGLSYWLSIVQTASSPADAYFSPFTRAWELAAGALVAVSAGWLRRLPALGAALGTWLGLGAIAGSAVVFTAGTAYPGALVAVPVLGAVGVIAGGVPEPAGSAEILLARRPCGWLGRRSYSLYLWHWPILIIVAEHAGRTSSPIGESLVLVLVSVVMAAVTYRLVENPIRHWRLPSRRTVGAGLVSVLVTLVLLSVLITITSGPSSPDQVTPAATVAEVEHQVRASADLTALPGSLEPSLARAPGDYGGWQIPLRCAAAEGQGSEGLCTFGDPTGSHLMVIYGDSHAVMWLPALRRIATTAHWRLIVLGKPYCPAETIGVMNPAGFGATGGRYQACDEWHQWAVRTINELRPSLVIISQENYYSRPATASVPAGPFSAAAWRVGLARLVLTLDVPRKDIVFLGNIPLLNQPGPECLGVHSDDVAACSAPVRASTLSLDATEQRASAEAGIHYIDVTPWFCSARCSAVIDHYEVYVDRFHVTGTYARYLESVLGQALGVLPAR